MGTGPFRRGSEWAEVARPAEFLIDPTEIVCWVNLTEGYRARLKAEEALKTVEQGKATVTGR
jgi:hypothetical protein